MTMILGDSDGPSAREAVIKVFIINSWSDGLISIYDHSVEEAAGVVSNNGNSDGAGSDFGDIWEFREPNIMPWGYLQV